jgi:hypothetical protein
MDIKMKKLALVAILASTASLTHAIDNQKTVCTHDNTQRIIEVVYTGETALPCEVHYTKGTQSQVLWSAHNSENYCESKAAEFVQKQQAWGWNCAAEATTEATTEELTPAAPEATTEATTTEENPSTEAVETTTDAE